MLTNPSFLSSRCWSGSSGPAAVHIRRRPFAAPEPTRRYPTLFRLVLFTPLRDKCGFRLLVQLVKRVGMHAPTDAAQVFGNDEVVFPGLERAGPRPLAGRGSSPLLIEHCWARSPKGRQPSRGGLLRPGEGNKHKTPRCEELQGIPGQLREGEPPDRILRQHPIGMDA
jgi:hypothetical protein